MSETEEQPMEGQPGVTEAGEEVPPSDEGEATEEDETSEGDESAA
jgi:hypothetical protein